MMSGGSTVQQQVASVGSVAARAMIGSTDARTADAADAARVQLMVLIVRTEKVLQLRVVMIVLLANNADTTVPI